MNHIPSKLHKTEMVSNHVLNLRGAKTPREMRIEAARNNLKNRVHTQRQSQTLAFTEPSNTSERESDAVFSRQSKQYTLSLSPIKTLALFLMILINFSAVFGVGPTSSYYSDSENTNQNAMTAGLVDFTLETTPFAENATTSHTESWIVDVQPHEESNPFYYYASSTNFSGNLELCEVITVIATLDGQVMYDGLLSDMVTASTTLIDQWTFEFSNAVGYPGEMCHFDIDFDGWQTRHDIQEGGYSDTETVTYWILDPSLVISKVYFAESSSTQDWVELYNPTNDPIDISDGFLCDNNSCDQLPPTLPIPAGGYALIAGSADIESQLEIPDGVELIVVPDGVVGDGLSVSGDMLELRLSLGQPIDRLNWGISDVSWINYTSELWTPGLPVPDSGGAFARQPVGVDTNMPDDWVALQLPTIEMISPDAESLWQAGDTVDIEWIAENLNGDDSELQIDIYYIDASSTEYTIALDTENDGLESWTVPDEPGEEILIKIVVTGPENILLNRIIETRFVIACGEDSTSPLCNGVYLHLSKAISGDSQGYELSDFSYRVTGTGTDAVVPHNSTILLQEGIYSIEELVPEGFVKEDWRIGWYGACEKGNTFFTTIMIDDGNIDHGTLYCQADNQYRPDSRRRTTETSDRSQVLGVATTTESETVTTSDDSQATSTEETGVESNSTTTSETSTSAETEIASETATTSISESVAEEDVANTNDGATTELETEGGGEGTVLEEAEAEASDDGPPPESEDETSTSEETVIEEAIIEEVAVEVVSEV